ncbi:MAG: hypothetical protein GY851_15325 [bacterium]|nr:hypothetical protein [bacterium]
MRTFCIGTLAVAFAVVCMPEAAGAAGEPGYVIVNWDEECMWAPIMGNRNLNDANPAHIKSMVERIVDEHARVGVDSIVHCVLGTGFRSHIPDSKYTDLLTEFRPPKLDAAGIDYFQVVMDRCKHHNVEFIAGIRMNDRHEIPPGTFIKEHPEWKLKAFNSNAMDYTVPEIRQHILDVTQETLDRYDVDGIEYDYMRWCHMFDPGKGKENAHLLTDMHRKARKLVDEAAERRGRSRLKFGVRVPQTPYENEVLGFDIKTWIQEGLVDYVVPADFFYTDFNFRVEDFVGLTEGTDCKIYPQIAPCFCWKGNMREVNLNHYRAAVNNFHAMGADGFSPYNYQVHWQRRRHPSRDWSRPVSWPGALAWLQELKDPNSLAQGNRHYLFFPLWDRNSETSVPNDHRIRLKRESKEVRGTQRLRMCEDFTRPGLRVTLQLKAEGIEESEHLEIALNGHIVPDAWTTRVPAPDGQPEADGYPLAAFDEYTVDFAWVPVGDVLVKGDNELSVRLTGSDPDAGGEVVVNEPEVYVHVRNRGAGQ